MSGQKEKQQEAQTAQQCAQQNDLSAFQRYVACNDPIKSKKQERKQKAVKETVFLKHGKTSRYLHNKVAQRRIEKSEMMTLCQLLVVDKILHLSYL
ncbi:MAG: hypothetical protein ACI3VI_00125 [Vescimonas sp.]